MLENQPGEIEVALENPQEVTEVVEQTPEPEVTEPVETQENNTEGEKVKKPRNSGFHKKISRLEQQNAELAARLAELSKPATVSTEKPNIDNFDSFDAYNEALLDWKVDQKEREREERVKQEQEKQKQVAKQNEAKSSWEQKIDALDESYDDYEEVVGKYNNVNVRHEIIQATAESDLGPQIRYHLAKNPDILESLNNDTASSLVIYKKIAELETKLSAKPTVKVSKSSEPITPVRGTAKTVVKLDGSTDADTWIAARHPHLYGKK